MKLTVDLAEKQWEAVKAIWLTGGVATVCLSPTHEENTALARGKVFAMTSLAFKRPCEEWAELCAPDRQPARAKEARRLIEYDTKNSQLLKQFLEKRGEIVRHQALSWQDGTSGVEAELRDGTVIAKVVRNETIQNNGRFRHFFGWQVVGYAG